MRKVYRFKLFHFLRNNVLTTGVCWACVAYGIFENEIMCQDLMSLETDRTHLEL